MHAQQVRQFPLKPSLQNWHNSSDSHIIPYTNIGGNPPGCYRDSSCGIADGVPFSTVNGQVALKLSGFDARMQVGGPVGAQRHLTDFNPAESGARGVPSSAGFDHSHDRRHRTRMICGRVSRPVRTGMTHRDCTFTPMRNAKPQRAKAGAIGIAMRASVANMACTVLGGTVDPGNQPRNLPHAYHRKDPSITGCFNCSRHDLLARRCG